MSDIFIKEKILDDLQNYLHNMPSNAIIISDEIILDNLKLELFNQLNYPKHILSAQIKASKNNAIELADKAKKHDLYIAIGSGTINDLVKYAAYLNNKPYIIIATAPSMNGYLSCNSSLIEDGLKQNFTAKSAIAAFFDLNILANSPMRLIKSGFGDSICSTTARADWVLSHYLIDSYYDEEYFNNTYELENKLFHNPGKILARDKDSIELLIKILIKSGQNMAKLGSSHPASGAEHMIAHSYEMLDPQNSAKSYHGEQIAVTTNYMIKIQEKILSSSQAPKFSNISKKSNFSNQEITEIQNKLASNWPVIKEKIKEKYRSSQEIYDILNQANISITPCDLGWSKSFYEQAKNQAIDSRNRICFLNLLL